MYVHISMYKYIHTYVYISTYVCEANCNMHADLLELAANLFATYIHIVNIYTLRYIYKYICAIYTNYNTKKVKNIQKSNTKYTYICKQIFTQLRDTPTF